MLLNSSQPNMDRVTFIIAAAAVISIASAAPVAEVDISVPAQDSVSVSFWRRIELKTGQTYRVFSIFSISFLDATWEHKWLIQTTWRMN